MKNDHTIETTVSIYNMVSRKVYSVNNNLFKYIHCQNKAENTIVTTVSLQLYCYIAKQPVFTSTVVFELRSNSYLPVTGLHFLLLCQNPHAPIGTPRLANAFLSSEAHQV
jgi:hypothetical protein